MSGFDTSIGGQDRAFRNTAWSMILAAGDPDHPRFQEYWGRLLHEYWKPVYCYIRAAWRKSSEDAKDLTQAFFAHLLEKGTLARLHPQYGSFRGYLKRALSHFLIDADRARKARLPEKPLFSIDAKPEAFQALEPASREGTPDQVFDRQWFRCLFEAGVRDLEEALTQDRKAVYFEVFKHYCLNPEESADPARSAEFLSRSTSAGPTYRELAKKLKLHESDVRNYLRYCRVELKRILKERIRDYVAQESDVDVELQEVLQG